MKKRMLVILFVVPLIFGGLNVTAQQSDAKNTGDKVEKPTELVVLWTTSEKDVFTKMINIYVYNAKKLSWFDDITLIVWGPSSKLLAEDEELKEMIKKLKEVGVTLDACIWCSDQYGVTKDLKNLGIDVRGMGKSLTEYIKDSGKEVIVF